MHKFVVAFYAVDRCYGGPEEAGGGTIPANSSGSTACSIQRTRRPEPPRAPTGCSTWFSAFTPGSIRYSTPAVATAPASLSGMHRRISRK